MLLDGSATVDPAPETKADLATSTCLVTSPKNILFGSSVPVANVSVFNIELPDDTS